MIKIGKYIKECRIGNDMTQAELAEKLGVNTSTVGNWEIGRKLPQLETFLKMAQILEVTADELCGFEELPKLYNDNNNDNK